MLSALGTGRRQEFCHFLNPGTVIYICFPETKVSVFLTADEVLAAEMKLEKVQHELLAKIEQNNSIQNEVSAGTNQSELAS